jgi:multidrug efflux pump subunit AcrB
MRLDQWAESAKGLVAEFVAGAPIGVELEIAFDQSHYTKQRLASLGANLLGGAGVVLLALGWRAALVVGSALPLSAAAALFGLALLGQQIHQMTIFGLIVAVGLLIDTAIVVSDETRHNLQLGLSPRAAIVATVGHLAGPLLASTVTTVLGFMPILLLPGNVGDFVGPIATSVVLALLASLAIALTVVAVLAARFLGNAGSSRSGGLWVRGVQSAYLGLWWRALISASGRRPVVAIPLAAAPALLGFALVPTLGQQFFPPADRDQFEIEVRLPPGTSLAQV